MLIKNSNVATNYILKWKDQILISFECWMFGSNLQEVCRDYDDMGSGAPNSYCNYFEVMADGFVIYMSLGSDLFLM